MRLSSMGISSIWTLTVKTKTFGGSLSKGSKPRSHVTGGPINPLHLKMLWPLQEVRVEVAKSFM